MLTEWQRVWVLVIWVLAILIAIIKDKFKRK